MDIIESCGLMAQNMRRQIVQMTYGAGNLGAHIGGSLSCVEILVALYSSAMNINNENLASEARNRFILSKGHAAMALYAVLEQAGVLSEGDIKSFKQNGSLYGTHPYMNIEKGIEFSSGSLGQGLSLAVGTALAVRLKNNGASRIFVLMGDGECDEGSVWEAAMSASHYRLDNITLIVDRNRLQSDGFTQSVMSLDDLSEKFQSFGWNAAVVDGHSIDEMTRALSLKHSGKPLAIIAETTKGKCVSFMENNAAWHNNRLTQSQYEQALEEVGSN